MGGQWPIASCRESEGMTCKMPGQPDRSRRRLTRVMTNDKPSSTQPSAWTWNARGWFGGQIGATIAMLIEGLLILRRDLLSGVVCLGGWLVLNALGLFLWSRRDRWSAYQGIQAFMGVLSVVAAIV